MALFAMWSLGCASIPKGMAAVDAVWVEGNKELSGSEVADKMATTASPRFLEMFQGFIYDYQLFNNSVLQRDLERVERYYRARGFYEAEARAGRVHAKGEQHVQIVVEVNEGEPVLIHELVANGLAGVSAEDRDAVSTAMNDLLVKGKRFEEEPFDKAAQAMKRALTDVGYAWAKVSRRAEVDLPAHHARLTFDVSPGPKATFGAVQIAGLGDLPEEPVRRALDISEKDPYSTDDIDSAQRAVLNLGTFGSVEIIADLPEPPPPSAIVGLKVQVQRQKLKSVMLGGGIQLDSVRTEAHLRVGWEHKNLFGGFRHFSVDFKPGLNLYPTRVPTFEAPTTVLPEERFRVEFRQPGFLEARTNGVVSQELNTYPLLLSAKVDPEAPVLGYLEYKGSLGLDRTLWKIFASTSYNLQWNNPFTYIGTLDADLRSIVISYLDLLTQLDFRDDRLRPHEGFHLQNDFQFAGLGGDAQDFRVQPEARGYIPLGKKVTVAVRATVGFLFPLNYGGNTKVDPADPESRAAWIRDISLTYLRGFFSGGPSSNRGYPLRGVGPHGTVPFFSPDLQVQALAAACDLQNPNYDPLRCAVPLGGSTLWEASLEVRFPIAGDFGGNVFCDTGDVSAKSADLRFDYPHLSCGIGLRYDTPIGPVRLDVGYRIPGAQVPNGVDLRLQGDPGEIFGVPLAFAFGIGEVF